jgi:hypothetical protein
MLLVEAFLKKALLKFTAAKASNFCEALAAWV